MLGPSVTAATPRHDPGLPPHPTSHRARPTGGGGPASRDAASPTDRNTGAFKSAGQAPTGARLPTRLVHLPRKAPACGPASVDCYVTRDQKHHCFLAAQPAGDAGRFAATASPQCSDHDGAKDGQITIVEVVDHGAAHCINQGGTASAAALHESDAFDQPRRLPGVALRGTRGTQI